MKTRSVGLLFVLIGLFTPLAMAGRNDFTREEQALLDRGAVVQMYKPDEHSRHFIGKIDTVAPESGKPAKLSKNAQTVLCIVFGMEDAKPARDEGRSMAECNYGPAQAHEFLFAEAWDKYHDRFFTRCYVQEGENAYNEARKDREKPADPASTS